MKNQLREREKVREVAKLDSFLFFSSICRESLLQELCLRMPQS